MPPVCPRSHRFLWRPHQSQPQRREPSRLHVSPLEAPSARGRRQYCQRWPRLVDASYTWLRQPPSSIDNSDLQTRTGSSPKVDWLWGIRWDAMDGCQHAITRWAQGMRDEPNHHFRRYLQRAFAQTLLLSRKRGANLRVV
jgi:hypothetical protein